MTAPAIPTSPTTTVQNALGILDGAPDSLQLSAFWLTDDKLDELAGHYRHRDASVDDHWISLRDGEGVATGRQRVVGVRFPPGVYMTFHGVTQALA